MRTSKSITALLAVVVVIIHQINACLQGSMFVPTIGCTNNIKYCGPTNTYIYFPTSSDALTLTANPGWVSVLQTSFWMKMVSPPVADNRFFQLGDDGSRNIQLSFTGGYNLQLNGIVTLTSSSNEVTSRLREWHLYSFYSQPNEGGSWDIIVAIDDVTVASGAGGDEFGFTNGVGTWRVGGHAESYFDEIRIHHDARYGPTQQFNYLSDGIASNSQEITASVFTFSENRGTVARDSVREMTTDRYASRVIPGGVWPGTDGFPLTGGVTWANGTCYSHCGDSELDLGHTGDTVVFSPLDPSITLNGRDLTIAFWVRQKSFVSVPTGGMPAHDDEFNMFQFGPDINDNDGTDNQVLRFSLGWLEEYILTSYVQSSAVTFSKPGIRTSVSWLIQEYNEWSHWTITMKPIPAESRIEPHIYRNGKEVTFGQTNGAVWGSTPTGIVVERLTLGGNRYTIDDFMVWQDYIIPPDVALASYQNNTWPIQNGFLVMNLPFSEQTGRNVHDSSGLAGTAVGVFSTGNASWVFCGSPSSTAVSSSSSTAGSLSSSSSSSTAGSPPSSTASSTQPDTPTTITVDQTISSSSATDDSVVSSSTTQTLITASSSANEKIGLAIMFSVLGITLVVSLTVAATAPTLVSIPFRSNPTTSETSPLFSNP